MRAWAQIAVLIVFAGQGSAGADVQKPTASPAPLPEKQLTLEKFGEADKACLQWSDGCAVCKRNEDGTFGCSVIGIACQPSKVECRQTAGDAKPAGARPQPEK